jgi:fructuronate reductase
MAGRERLSGRTLGRANGAALPGYDRARAAVGIVHLGVGNFFRAHQAVYTDDCLNAGEIGWAIHGTSLRSADTRDALAPQDGLYAVVERDGAEERARIVGSLKELSVAPENPAALVARMADPAVRIVTSTVTEKAYLRDAKGNLDLSHPDVSHDLKNLDRPKSVHGFIAAALRVRRARGVAPFTVLCCDNLPDNGGTLRRLSLQFAEALVGDYRSFVEHEVAFPSTMVDRIVPATTDVDRANIAERLGLEDAWPVFTEPFRQWVIEDHFTAGRPRWEDHGTEMVKDVKPYEEMKLRLLNGSHSGMAYLGVLSGREMVADAFGDPLIRRFVERLWGEAAATLSPLLDTEAYRGALSKRFANTAIRHRCAQIAMDGSQKLPQRVIATARERLAEGQNADALMLVPAAWIAAAEQRGKRLPAGLFTDPLDAKLATIFAAGHGAEQTVRDVFAAAGFSVASAEDPLIPIAARHLAALRDRGVAATLSAFLETL